MIDELNDVGIFHEDEPLGAEAQVFEPWDERFASAAFMPEVVNRL